MKQRTTLIVGAAISVVMIGIVLAGVDLDRVRGALADARYEYLIPTFAVLVAANVTRAVRWRALLMSRLPFRHAFSILNVSYLFNGALPFRLGEVARIFLITQVDPPIPAFTALSTILVERLLDLLVVIAMLGVVLVFLPVPGFVTSAGVTLGIASLVGVIGLVVIARRPAWAFRLQALAERLFPFLIQVALHNVVQRLLDGLQSLTTWYGVFTALFWSIISWGLSVLGGYILMLAFFPQPTWVAVLFFIGLASLAVAVPYAPGAVGPFEAGVVLALGRTGFDQPEGAAVAFAILLHATNLAVFLVLGILGLLQEGVTLGQVTRGVRKLDAAPLPGMVE